MLCSIGGKVSFYIKVLLAQLLAACLEEMQILDDLWCLPFNLNALISVVLDKNICQIAYNEHLLRFSSHNSTKSQENVKIYNHLKIAG